LNFIFNGMKAQKDEVLNLFYLFNEGDLYKVAGEKQPPARSFDLKEQVEEMPPLPAVETEQPTPPRTLVTSESAFVDTTQPEDALSDLTELTETAVEAKELPLPAETQLPVISPTSVEQKGPVVENDKPAVAEAPVASSPIWLLVREPKAATLSAKDEAFLDKVLQAVGLSLAQVTLINVHSVPEPDYYYIFKTKNVHQFISFGVPMDEMNMYLPLEPYEVKPIYGIQFLCVDTLERIRTDVMLKKALWNALKQMFNA
jgi:hypothetical protein